MTQPFFTNKDDLAFERLKRILELCEHKTRFGIISGEMYSYDGCSVDTTRRYARKLAREGFLVQTQVMSNVIFYQAIKSDYPFDLVVSEEEKERRILFQSASTPRGKSAKQANANPYARVFNIDEKDKNGKYIYQDKYNETAKMDKKKSPKNYCNSNSLAMF
jgi:hypothetical protein